MKRMMNLATIGLCLVVLFSAFSSASFAAEKPLMWQGKKFPSSPIVIVCAGSIGGGSDVQARLIQGVIEKRFKLGQPVVVLNKGGSAGGADAFIITEKKASPYYISPIQMQIWNFAINGSQYRALDFVPLANLVMDPEVVIVPANSPYKTLADLIAAAKKRPGELTVASTQVGSADNVGLMQLQDATGTQFRLVSFSGGGNIHREVLSGRFDMAFTNPSDVIPSVEAGKLRLLVQTTATRSQAPTLRNVPTLKESGYNVSYAIHRGVFGCPGLPMEFIKFYENLFKTVLEDSEFQEKYVKRFGMVPAFMGYEEYRKYLKPVYANYIKVLRDKGLVKDLPDYLDPAKPHPQFSD